MAYTDETLFKKQYLQWIPTTWPGATQFAQLIIDASSDINVFLRKDADVCSVGDGTWESRAIEKVIGNLLNQKLTWLRIWKRTPTTQQKADNPEPTLYDMENAALREVLVPIRRANKKSALNFSMRTGRIIK